MKQPIRQFAVGDRVVNTQGVSFYFGKQGVVQEIGHKGKNSIRIAYGGGSTETMTGEKVWLQKREV